MTRPASRMDRATLALAIVVCVFSAAAVAADLTEYGALELEYKDGMQRVVPSFEKSYGKYLGSGVGRLKGKLEGSVAWDLYEEQSDPKLHRTQFVGRITAPDGSAIDFETTGYFVPRREAGPFWDLTSAIYFSHVRGEAYELLAGRVGLLEGHVQVVDAATYVHTYTVYFPQ